MNYIHTMPYKLLLSFAFYINVQCSHAQFNLQQLGHFTYPNNVSAGNLTGYVDSLGREYALVGTSQGLSIVAIDTPTNPRELFLVPGATGNGAFWREVREYKGYAYVTTEANSGLVIVNLNYLPDSIQYHMVNPLGMRTSHTIFIDENGIAYVSGTDRDQLFLDLNANPYNPPVLGRFTNNYVHDCFVRNDTMWASCINDGIIKVVDVRNKTTTDNAASQIASWSTPLDFSHNCWLSDDSKYLFTTDEKPNSTLTCYDVSDLGNVTETGRTQVAPGSNTIIHNTYYINGYAVTSYYTYGVTIHDVTRKNNLQEVANFDTSPGFSGDGFHGAWGVWPYLPSGNIIVSDIETGLWILRPAYVRACYLEGVVKDSSCNTLLNNVTIQILNSSVSSQTDFLGKYKTGIIDSGVYSIRFSKNGYMTKDVPGVQLKNGVLSIINVSLVPASTAQLTIQTTDASAGTAVPFVNVQIRDTANSIVQEISTDADAQYNFCDFVQNEYYFYSGNWGRRTSLSSVSVNPVIDTVTLSTAKAYYDDFIMNYGWTVNGTSSSGEWERGIPQGTDFDDLPSNPGEDIAGDFGGECYVTGNNGGAAGDDDVDGGYTILTSPVFDLSGYADPYLSYYRWFFNDGGQGTPPNDSLIVRLYNGIDSALIDLVDSSVNQWTFKNFRVKDFILPTADMRIRFKAQDSNPGHLVEAGVDVFQVVDSGAVAVGVRAIESLGINMYPNPAVNYIAVEKSTNQSLKAFICDLTGRVVKEDQLIENVTFISIKDLAMGMYIVKLIQEGRIVSERKLVKTE